MKTLYSVDDFFLPLHAADRSNIVFGNLKYFHTSCNFGNEKAESCIMYAEILVITDFVIRNYLETF